MKDTEAIVRHASPVTQAGFTQIPNVVMLRGDLSPLARLIYGYLKHLAWRNHTPTVDPLREVVAADLGVSEKTVTAALRELRDADLVETIRRGQGRTNVYVVHDPPDPGQSRKGDPPSLENLDRPIPSSLRVKTEDLDVNLPATAAPVAAGTPKLTKVDGRDLAFDTLAEVCSIADGSPRLSLVAVALNGRRGHPEEGIRWQVWRPLAETAPDAAVEGAPFEQYLAVAIRGAADLYRRKMNGAHLTPTALAKWWTDLPRLPDPSGRSVSALDILAARDQRTREETS